MNAHANHPLYLRHRQWVLDTALLLRSNRGSCAALARDMGLARQTVHRWFFGHTPMPAWAIVPINRWLRLKQTDLQPPLPVRLG